MNKLQLFIIFCIFLIACSTSKIHYQKCKYKVLERFTNNGNVFFNDEYHYLAYNNFLFEFKIRPNEIGKVDFNIQNGNQQISESISLDTTDIQVFDAAKGNFIKIDSFKINFQIKKAGKINDTKMGIDASIKEGNDQNNKKLKFLKDTILNNMHYLYKENISKDSSGKDSDLAKIFYIQGSHLLSPFNISQKYDTYKRISPAGLFFYSFNSKDGNNIMAENINNLSKNEMKICKKVIKKMSTLTSVR